MSGLGLAEMTEMKKAAAIGTNLRQGRNPR